MAERVTEVFVISQTPYMKTPRVSVIILNWNGKKWLQKCLPSLSRIRYPNIEIIVVNNGSTDDSETYMRSRFPKIRIITLVRNVGYAKACNIGAKHATGEYLLLINNDTTVTRDFLMPLVDAMEKDKTIGIVQPQIRSMIHTDLLDSVGAFLTVTGFLYYFGMLKPHALALYARPLFVYSIKGACFLVSKKDYMTLGGFDESFFSYVEETDLCHRMWLYGKKVLYEPASVIYHWGGGDTLVATKSEASFFRAFRNRFLSYIKNFGPKNLIKILPVHFIVCELSVIAFLLKRQFRMALALQLGSVAWLYSLPDVLHKRSHIQSVIRKVRDEDIDPYIMKQPRLMYYWVCFQDIRKYKD